MSHKTALISGATGLVGRELIQLLLKHDYYSKIVVLTRRNIDVEDDRLEIVIVNDFEELMNFESTFDVHHHYCLLGTTMKKAGSKVAFMKIDHDYPFQLAQLAGRQPNFEHFLLVTSLGANAKSKIFYNRVKGETEDSIISLGLKSLKIFRPSLLLGHRDELRIGEEVGKILSTILSFFIIGYKRKLWTIHGDEVAKAMFNVAKDETQGLQKFQPQDMLKIAKK